MKPRKGWIEKWVEENQPPYVNCGICKAKLKNGWCLWDPEWKELCNKCGKQLEKEKKERGNF